MSAAGMVSPTKTLQTYAHTVNFKNFYIHALPAKILLLTALDVV